MPYCNNCGNESHFAFYIEQSEERFYDPETGEHVENGHTEVYDSYVEACGECGSEDIAAE